MTYTPAERFEQLKTYLVETGATAADQTIDLNADMRIICGDDGIQVIYRGGCPVCTTKHWIPAAEVGLKMVQRLRAKRKRAA